MRPKCRVINKDVFIHVLKLLPGIYLYPDAKSGIKVPGLQKRNKNMHELGVVFHIIDDLKEVGKENNIEKIHSVTLQLGEVSGVVPDLLTDAWKWASDKTDLMKGAELIIETLPAVTFCEDCKSEYETVKYGRTCPNCGSGHTYLLKGNEFMIKEIAAT